MFKISLFLFLAINILFSKEIQFNETKYIYALDNEFSKIGKISINNKKIVLEYSKSAKKVIYTQNMIQTIDNNAIENFTHEENIEYELFFRLVIAIYNNELGKLEENFLIKRHKEEVTLFPKEQIASIIKKISFEKKEERLKYLTIYFVNQDRITIEQTN